MLLWQYMADAPDDNQVRYLHHLIFKIYKKNFDGKIGTENVTLPPILLHVRAVVEIRFRENFSIDVSFLF